MTTTEATEVVRLGEIAQEVSVHVRDPIAEGLTRYVALEHIEPGSLKVERWGHLANGTSFTKRFRSGHLLFPKRRVYQRKVAVADFDGICSSDIIVIEADQSRLLPEYLKFMAQTDPFFDHAIRTSSGSLSPRTKWKHLANLSVRVPSLDRQRDIVAVLNAAERGLDATVRAGREAKALLVGLGERLIGDSGGETVETHKLGDVLGQVQYGLNTPPGTDGEHPILRMGNLSKGRVDLTDLKYVDLDAAEFEQYRLNQGDLLFNRTNSPDLVGKIALYDLDGSHVFASYLLRLVVNRQRALPEFVSFHLSRPTVQAQLRQLATPGVSQSNINPTSLKSISIPLPSLDRQGLICDALSAVDTESQRLDDHRLALIAVRTQTANELIAE